MQINTMQSQTMAHLIVSNVSSIVAICAKAYNSYPPKVVIFPDRWSQQHRCYTGTWARLCQWSLAWVWESTGQNISSFCLDHTVVSGKIQTSLLDPPRSDGEKLEPSHEEKGSTFQLPLPLESFVSFSKSPESVWAQLSLHYCCHSA